MAESKPGPTQDRRWLDRAIHLACEGVDAGAGGPFGAVVVREGRLLGEGHNRVLADRDPSAHAELVAIRRACAAEDHFHLTGATLYTSCEPCPMCLAAAYWAHVERIVYAATRDDAARGGFDDADIYRELALPVDARRIRCEHAPAADAQRPFACWQARDQRIPY